MSTDYDQPYDDKDQANGSFPGYTHQGFDPAIHSSGKDANNNWVYNAAGLAHQAQQASGVGSQIKAPIPQDQAKSGLIGQIASNWTPPPMPTMPGLQPLQGAMTTDQAGKLLTGMGQGIGDTSFGNALTSAGGGLTGIGSGSMLSGLGGLIGALL